MEAAGCLAVGFEVARDVDAASPRARVPLMPFDVLGGGGILREIGSPACSASVFRCLNAGSGTGRVSDLSGATGMKRGSLQPEGLCLAVGIGIPLRAFAPASCNSPRALGGGEVMWEKVDGGLMPERFAIPYNGREIRLEPGKGWGYVQCSRWQSPSLNCVYLRLAKGKITVKHTPARPKAQARRRCR